MQVAGINVVQGAQVAPCCCGWHTHACQVPRQVTMQRLTGIHTTAHVQAASTDRVYNQYLISTRQSASAQGGHAGRCKAPAAAGTPATRCMTLHPMPPTTVHMAIRPACCPHGQPTIVPGAVAGGPWRGCPVALIFGVCVTQIDAIPRGAVALPGALLIQHKGRAITDGAHQMAALRARAVVRVTRGEGGGFLCGTAGAAGDATAVLGALAIA
jgi:hypothetical protein